MKCLAKAAILLLFLAVLLSGSRCNPTENTPSDTTAPTISNVAASEITQTSAKITWTTDDPSSSQVEYSPTRDFGTTSPLDSGLVTSHSLTITGLIPGTLYYYTVKSKDASGNEGSSSSWDVFLVPAEQNLTVGQATQNASNKVTVKAAVRVDHYDWESSGYTYTEYPASGKIFIIVDAEVENKTSGSVAFYSYEGDFSISDDQGYKYEYGSYLANDKFSSVELYGGQKTGGKVLFEVPIGATGLKLAYNFGNFGPYSTAVLATWVIPDAS